MKIIVACMMLMLTGAAFAQNPQTQTAPIVALNAKWINGIAPGYAPTSGAGLHVVIGPGTVNCNGIITTYGGTGGGGLVLLANTTNYVYLNTASNCAVAVKNTGFLSSDVPIASVLTGSSAITSISDVRTSFSYFDGSLRNGIGQDGSYYPSTCGVSPASSWCAGSDFGAWTNAAIQAATASCTRAGVVSFVPSTFTVSTTINPCAYTYFKFNGATLQPDSTSHINYVFDVFQTGTHDVSFMGPGRLNGLSVLNVDGNPIAAIGLSQVNVGAYNMTVSNLIVDHFSGEGVYNETYTQLSSCTYAAGPPQTMTCAYPGTLDPVTVNPSITIHSGAGDLLHAIDGQTFTATSNGLGSFTFPETTVVSSGATTATLGIQPRHFVFVNVQSTYNSLVYGEGGFAPGADDIEVSASEGSFNGSVSHTANGFSCAGCKYLIMNGFVARNNHGTGVWLGLDGNSQLGTKASLISAAAYDDGAGFQTANIAEVGAGTLGLNTWSSTGQGLTYEIHAGGSNAFNFNLTSGNSAGNTSPSIQFSPTITNLNTAKTFLGTLGAFVNQAATSFTLQGAGSNANQTCFANSSGTCTAFARNTGDWAFARHIAQSAAGTDVAHTCAMSASTSCTITLTNAFTSTPVCIAQPQTTTAIAGACSVSGATVTITAASSNSLTWGAIFGGNLN